MITVKETTKSAILALILANVEQNFLKMRMEFVYLVSPNTMLEYNGNPGKCGTESAT